jgi:DNA-binding IclR family transcriptional regulator
MSPVSDESDISSARSSSTISKAFTVLLALRRASSPLTLTAVAESVGIAPSSAHALLNQLMDQGAIAQDEEKRYQLGPTMLYLGAAYARSSRIYRSVWIELVTAANELSVTAALAVTWDDHHLVLNSHRAADSEVAVPFGGRVPLEAGSWGKTYYAATGAPLPAKLTGYTPSTITDRTKFEAELKQVRTLGYAIDDEEYDLGVGGVCAAITSDSGYEGLISFLASRAKVDELRFETLGRRLANLAARASLTLGDSSRVRFFGSE